METSTVNINNSCPDCGAPEFIQEVEIAGHKSIIKGYNCNCYNEKRDKLIKENRIKTIMSLIPKRYYFSKLENPSTQQVNAFLIASKYCNEFSITPTDTGINNGQGLFIFGNVGTGKTYLAHAVLKNIMLKFQSEAYNRKIMLTSETALFAKLRSVISVKGNLFDSINDYANAFLLLLDDIGKERYSDFVGNALFSIIDYRWDNMLPTIFTSNYMLDELQKRIGDDYGQPICSRINGMSKFVSLSGNDMRCNKEN